MRNIFRYTLAILVISISGFSFISKTNEKPSITPVQSNLQTEKPSEYGMRTHPVSKKQKLHTGIDFIAPLGTPVLATADGEVISVEKDAKKYGNRIIIQHTNQITTSYAHLQNMHVTIGQKVKQKDQIGTVGNTGASVNPHLHYEVSVNHIKVDPSKFLSN